MRRAANKFRENKQVITKVSLVVFITLLIWVWADLSQDEAYRDSTAVITISASADPSLWVRFEENNVSEIRLTQIRIEGPAIRIAELKRDLADGTHRLRFGFEPRDFDIADSQASISIPLMQILREDKELRKRGLKVTECTPESVTILATKLVEQRLTVVCLDENNLRLKNADIQPSNIKMLVPPTWQGQSLEAMVKLTPAQIARSRTQPIIAKPFIELIPGVVRLSDTTVEIELPETGINLENRTVPGSIGFIVTPDIAEKYKIELENPEDFHTALSIRATEQAYQAYMSQKYKLLLEIKSEDAQSDPAIGQPIYNFQQEYLQNGEIQGVERLQQAKFRLIPR